MLRSLCHGVLSLALASHVAIVPAMAPEHVHEADSGHAHAIVHRHLASHDHDGAEISHGEGRVIWLDDLSVAKTEYRLILPGVVDDATVEYAVLRPSWIATPCFDAAPPHGPPRSSQVLRAPPFLPV